jgi:hypothetical protein
MHLVKLCELMIVDCYQMNNLLQCCEKRRERRRNGKIRRIKRKRRKRRRRRSQRNIIGRVRVVRAKRSVSQEETEERRRRRERQEIWKDIEIVMTLIEEEILEMQDLWPEIDLEVESHERTCEEMIVTVTLARRADAMTDLGRGLDEVEVVPEREEKVERTDLVPGIDSSPDECSQVVTIIKNKN